MSKKQLQFLFTLFVCLFFLWGFAHSILDVLNKHFQDVLVISKSRSALVQVAVYLAYFIFSIPAGLFIKRFSYQKSIILGLFLFASGCFLFIPANNMMSFPFFIGALFVIGSGLTFLETASNPYIVALGDPNHGAGRLNFAQSFNGLGWIFGPMVGGYFIFQSDGSSGNVVIPYMIIGVLVLLIGLIFIFVKLPEIQNSDPTQDHVVKQNSTNIFKHKLFIFGVITLFCYVGAQTGINSFFINYMIELNTKIIPRDAAYILSFGGMGLFMAGRLMGSFILKKVHPPKVLAMVSIGAIISTFIVFLSLGTVSLIALLLSYLFMAIMFPTIFAISIQGLGDLTSKGSSLLIMSIVGGAVFPPIMGYVGESKISYGFLIPLVLFIVILLFAYTATRKTQKL
jgi:FHS family L-fucose permease-like MFS transporter